MLHLKMCCYKTNSGTFVQFILTTETLLRTTCLTFFYTCGIINATHFYGCPVCPQLMGALWIIIGMHLGIVLTGKHGGCPENSVYTQQNLFG